MAPRLRSGGNGLSPLLLTCVEGLSQRGGSRPLAGLTAIIQNQSQRITTPRSSSRSPPCSAPFSTSAPCELNREQRRMWAWLRGQGKKFKTAPDPDQPGPDGDTARGNGGGPNYVGSFDGTQVFRNNKLFKSEPVLSEKARDAIFSAVVEDQLPLKAVSQKFGVDMRRIAAVVRMRSIERNWIASKKPLAKPYQRAVLAMLPQADLNPGEMPFEPINDIHVHMATMQQLFHPTSESRHFTRRDAAKAFGAHTLPPDHKLRIPEMIDLERKLASGVPSEEAHDEFVAQTARTEASRAKRLKGRRTMAELNRTRVATDRFEFRFENFNSSAVGRTGRGRTAVGWRYGVPSHDRKPDQVKIPTKME
ncbi:eukaryotic mitochondrial regulator protein-domain-containing protein [Lasiosphaeria miniovina]|uniref:Eukaryotic mitochondrial regulator protein-domain-containing protein n=1 Tax=Lasiosphaeria miniovina TaxID=1954250 RepID=A0AA40AK32_9PEZI|nr:eukaryotic mitochondrial regulator protein-domain-containing protein [Lasiosphaeria miniovina]KAK0717239.1 eukaryotic mitochondrial regulator protein-domain-containing protein [Lasiosphaeria miniovina]